MAAQRGRDDARCDEADDGLPGCLARREMKGPQISREIWRDGPGEAGENNRGYGISLRGLRPHPRLSFMPRKSIHPGPKPVHTPTHTTMIEHGKRRGKGLGRQLGGRWQSEE